MDMALTVKRITLWRREVENQPGALASTLEPLAAAGGDLRLVLGYRFPDATGQAAVEVFPVTGKRVITAAQSVGLQPFNLACLLVEGDNRPGLGAVIGRSLADAGINIAFLVAQVIGRRYTAVVGFTDEADAGTAAKMIRRAASRRR